MLSFKRLLYIVLMVAVLGGIFLIYTISERRPASVQVQSCLAAEREFIETRQVDEGEKPRIWILGDSGDRCYGKIYDNVRQLCEYLHLTVTEEGCPNLSEAKGQDLVIFCDASISGYVDFKELEEFISGGGRVIFAAGLAEGNEDSCLWPTLGIREKAICENYHDLVFDKPLLPVQPERTYYDGTSNSARIKVSADASVYIKAGNNDVPIFYTYNWEKGSICLINGTFLTDIRYMGLLTGAIGALLPDFVYPVLGVKTVFLDHFPIITADDNELCRKVYGYSAEGFIRNVVWPAFQGLSLRTDTPCTFSIPAAAFSEEKFGAADGALFTDIGKLVLQFGGELVYAADCSEEGKIIFDQELIDWFTAAFPGYTVQGLVMETENFSPEIPDIPGADIRSVRRIAESSDMQFSWKNGRTVFPTATMGNSMEKGNLFTICSVLGAYGMVSHVFDIDMLIDENGNTAAWDMDKKQIGLFESEVLAHAAWLEGRTLTQIGDDVKSYQNMDYGWAKNGNRMELNCSNAAKGQAFFYHTDSRIVDARGLAYQDVGNGYYLLRIQESYGTITLEEEK